VRFELLFKLKKMKVAIFVCVLISMAIFEGENFALILGFKNKNSKIVFEKMRIFLS
jgi:hypothetical protein